MGRQENGGNGGRQENKRWSLIHGPSFLTVLLVISMIHVATSQDKMSTLDQGSNIIRSPRYAKTTGETNTQSSRVIPELRRSNGKRSIARICNTSECIDAASEINRLMNLTVDPCENFYEFACGRYRLQNPLNGKDKFNPETENEERLYYFLKQKLDKGFVNLNGASDEVMKIPSDIYKSCLNLSAIEREGDAPLKQLIREFGGWSMVEENGEWDEKKWDFAKAILSIHRNYISKGPLFLVRAWEDATDNSRYIFEIDQASLKGYYSTPNVDVYRRLIIRVARLLGGSVNLNQKVEELIDFETKLEKIRSPPTPQVKTTFNRITTTDLQKEVPTFNWYDHLKGMFAPKHLSKTEKFEVSALSYLKSAMELVNNSSKSVLSNYLVWYVIKDELPYMSRPYRRAYAQYEREINNETQTKKNERWRTCADYVNKYLTKDIVAAGFVADNFTKNVKIIKMVKKMMTEVRKAFKENVNSLTWVDSHTKRAILDKVDGMKDEPGFPKNLLDPTKLSKKFKRYENLNIRNDTLLSNRITIMKVKQKDMLAKFQKPMDQEEWVVLMPQEFLPGMNPYRNWLTIPMAYIHPPQFYPFERIRAVNFGSMGYAIGHEVTHGFAVGGRKFNKDGEIKGQLWTNKSLEGFDARLPCFVKQYSQYNELGIQFNGNSSLEENLSDTTGIKAALKAYYNWANVNPSEKWLLPGLDFTNEQLFYIGFAQTNCYHGNYNYVKSTSNSPYATGKMRVIGTLSNSCEFANSFKCKINSPMNPLKKCALWNPKGSLV